MEVISLHLEQQYLRCRHLDRKQTRFSNPDHWSAFGIRDRGATNADFLTPLTQIDQIASP